MLALTRIRLNRIKLRIEWSSSLRVCASPCLYQFMKKKTELYTKESKERMNKKCAPIWWKQKIDKSLWTVMLYGDDSSTMAESVLVWQYKEKMRKKLNKFWTGAKSDFLLHVSFIKQLSISKLTQTSLEKNNRDLLCFSYDYRRFSSSSARDWVDNLLLCCIQVHILLAKCCAAAKVCVRACVRVIVLFFSFLAVTFVVFSQSFFECIPFWLHSRKLFALHNLKL